MPKFLSSLRGIPIKSERRSNPIHVILSKAKNLIAFPSRFTLHPSPLYLPFGQKGQSSAYIIIFVIVIIFAVMLSGGASSLFSGNHPSSVIDTPTPTTAAGASPSPTISPSNGWNITVILDSCKPGKSPSISGTVKVEGHTNGTVELTVGTKSIGTQSFTPPSGIFPITLSNDDGFNTNNWKITVTSGGTVQKIYNGNATGCT